MDYFDDLISKYRLRGVLVDTNLLLLFLIGTLDTSFISDFKRTNTFDVDAFEMLCSILEEFSRLVVTPHILAEVSNLGSQIGDTKGQQKRSEFFALLIDSITRFTEIYEPSSAAISEPYFTKLGITDSNILKVAQGKFLILTADFPLSQIAQQQGIDVINFNHIRTSGWNL